MSGAQASALLGLARDEVAPLRDMAASTLVRAVEVVSLSEAEPEWRLFERTACASPYQRYDWIAAYARTVHGHDGSQIVVALGRDSNGSLQFILPMRLTSRFGVKVARYIGGKHANLNMPLLTHLALSKLDTAAWKDILQTIARSLGGVDVFLLQNQPRRWQGHVNRLAELGTVEALDDVHMLGLSPDAETRLSTLLSKDRRKKLRAKVRRLSEMGEIRFTDPYNDDERQLAVSSFLDQKAQRFRQQGIPDPFAAPEIRDFLLAASAPGTSGEAPAVEFHALKVGDRVAATVAGIGNATRFSTMCISFDGSPEIARDSPGDQILVHLIQRQGELGRTEFDLGMGEASYKEVFCDTRERLAHTLHATSLPGVAAVLLQRVADRMKRVVKHHPALLRIIRLLQVRG